MEVKSGISRGHPNGIIEVLPLGKPQAGPSDFLAGIVSRSRYVWRPPWQITRLPSWYELALDCYITASGTRRFTLVELSECDSAQIGEGLGLVSTARGLLLVASIGGHRLLEARGELAPGLLLTNDEARLFLQHIEHRAEYLGPRTGLERALGVCAGGRADRATKTILPEDLGLDTNGEGDRWTIGRLSEEGQDAARAMGIEDPTPQQVLSFGLMEAAKRNPLYLDSVDESAAVVRMALFALPESTDEVTHEQLSYVATHVRSSLHGHLDDSNEQFDKWIKDPDSNLLHRISKRQDCLIPRDQVKRALLELGWRSLQMIGRCVDVQMQAFRDAFTDPLSKRENLYFSHVFLANPDYGGLPLLLLNERYEILNGPVVNLWNNPGDRHSVAVLHRVLLYYAELIGNRRAADTIYKRRALARNKDARVPTEATIVVEPAASTNQLGAKNL
jgi:hypothetical protein